MSNSEPPTLRDLEAPESDFKTVSNGPLPPDSEPAEDITFSAKDAQSMMEFFERTEARAVAAHDATIRFVDSALAELHQLGRRLHELKNDVTANSVGLEKVEKMIDHHETRIAKLEDLIRGPDATQ